MRPTSSALKFMGLHPSVEIRDEAYEVRLGDLEWRDRWDKLEFIEGHSFFMGQRGSQFPKTLEAAGRTSAQSDGPGKAGEGKAYCTGFWKLVGGHTSGLLEEATWNKKSFPFPPGHG